MKEQVEIRWIDLRFSMFRAHVNPQNSLFIDCYKTPLMFVENVLSVKDAIDRFGIDSIIIGARPREVYNNFLVTNASFELAKWRQNAQQMGLYEIIQVDIDPDLKDQRVNPVAGITQRGK